MKKLPAAKNLIGKFKRKRFGLRNTNINSGKLLAVIDCHGIAGGAAFIPPVPAYTLNKRSPLSSIDCKPLISIEAPQSYYLNKLDSLEPNSKEPNTET